MPIFKNVAGQKIAVYAWDDTTAAGNDPSKTGDASNITAQLSKDGGSSSALGDANPDELDATNQKGIYIFNLTQAETNANMLVLTPKSSTANVLLEPIVVFTVPGDGSRLDAAIDQAFPVNFEDLAITDTTGQVTVGTNNDKTGYSLSQSFPTNFSALLINGNGHVTRVTTVDTTTSNSDMRGTDGANTTVPPSASAIDTQLTSSHGSGSWQTGSGGSGSGARTVTVTVDDGTNTLQNATVRMTEGANAYTAVTNASGVATFNLDDATYTVAISKSGYSYPGSTQVVSGDVTATYSMTAITIASSSPNLTSGYLTVYDEVGVVESGVDITATLVGAPSGDRGIAYDTATRTQSSAANGLVTFTNMFPGATYDIQRGTDGAKKKRVKIPVDAASTYELPSIYGQE